MITGSRNLVSSGVLRTHLVFQLRSEREVEFTNLFSFCLFSVLFLRGQSPHLPAAFSVSLAFVFQSVSPWGKEFMGINKMFYSMARGR